MYHGLLNLDRCWLIIFSFLGADTFAMFLGRVTDWFSDSSVFFTSLKDHSFHLRQKGVHLLHYWLYHPSFLSLREGLSISCCTSISSLYNYSLAPSCVGVISCSKLCSCYHALVREMLSFRAVL